jgi:hypothetical protein
MKATLRELLFILVFFCPLIYSAGQIPQGFNYQAVAHNPSGGAVIANATLQVKAGILSDTLTPVVVWEELHSTVKTNAAGVFSIVIGSGTKQAGSAGSFSAIDWTKTQLFLKVQIYYQNSWKYMGSAKLWSVPYSMAAGSVPGSLKKLAVEGTETSPDSALFTVRNTEGQIVFAVYNEGVRVYVADGAKGSKGGFAVGGFTAEKAEAQEYLRVTPDSVRIYLDDTDGKGSKGGFAVGGFTEAKGGAANFFNVATDATGIINPSENRIVWYPIKNAFRSGKVLIVSPDSVGFNSTATGYESKAVGDYSQSFGYKSIARGDYSTAIGFYTEANGNESYAFGSAATASGSRSFAFGSVGVDTSGYITGDRTESRGDNSMAFGMGSRSFSKGAMTFGISNSATGAFSLAMGFESKTTGDNALAAGYRSSAVLNSTAIGYRAVASGSASAVLGYRSSAGNTGALALGYANSASGAYSLAAGYSNTASGNYATAIGYFNTAKSTSGGIAMGYRASSEGYYSIAMGYYPRSVAQYSNSIGFRTESRGNYSNAIGYYAKTTAAYSTAIGMFNNPVNNYTYYSYDTPLLMVGNGYLSYNGSSYDTIRTNAMEVYYGGYTKFYGDILAGKTTANVGSWSNPFLSAYLQTAPVITSDARLKEQIRELNYGLNEVMKLKPVSYSLRGSAEKKAHLGLLAQDLEGLIDEVIINENDRYSLRYTELIPVLIKAIQEQQALIEKQQKQIDALLNAVNK